MSQMISPSHLSIVLSRVEHENLDLTPGNLINAYMMVGDKDYASGAYKAVCSEEVTIQWLAEAQITQKLETVLSKATYFAAVGTMSAIFIVLTSSLL